MDKEEDLDIGRRTWIKSTLPIQQDAYREGYAVGREERFQKGFDIGYEYGFKNGYKMGFVNAALRVSAELDNKAIDGPEIDRYEFPHRGRCTICPSEGESISKEMMAELSSRHTSLTDVIEKQRKVEFPEEAIKSIYTVLGTAQDLHNN